MRNKRDKPKRAKAGLSVRVSNGKLVIDVGIEALAKMFDETEMIASSDCKPGFMKLLRVKSASLFAGDIRKALLKEPDDDLSAMLIVFDNIFEEAVEEGSEGSLEEYWVEEDGDA